MKKKLINALFSMTAVLLAASSFTGITAFASETQYEGGDNAKIYITTKNGNGNEIEKADGYQKSTITVVSPVDENGQFTVLEDTGKIKVRGNSTSLAEKKPFNIKFDSKQDVLGMGKGKKWCLLANCFDPSLMRNYTAFELANDLDLAYTPDSEFAELWLDGVFKGCYMITEPIESGSTRIDIDTEADDFMIEYEAYRDEELVSYVTADNGSLRFAVSEPEMPDPSDYEESDAEQYAADMAEYNLRIDDINEKVNNITEIIKNGTYEEICEVIDMESFVDYYVMNELMKTCDFNWSSVNFYYSDGKLHAGPAWDYDLSSGNTNTEYPSLVTSESEKAYVENFADFATNSSVEGMYAANCNFYKLLTKNDEFMNDVKEVFLEEQDFINGLVADNGKLDQVYNENLDMFTRNYTSIEEGGAGWIASKSYADTMKVPFATVSENYDFFKNWLSERNNYLYESFIGHEFDENGVCKHCGVKENNFEYGKEYALDDYAHISGVKITFKKDVAEDFSGNVVLGDYAVSGSINKGTCKGNTYELSFNPLSLWAKPDTITVNKWSGEDPEIASIDYVYVKDEMPVIPETSVVLTSENNSFDISGYNKDEIKSITLILKNEAYNGGGQIVFDNYSSSSFNINRAAGKAITVNVSNVSNKFNVNLWGDSCEIDKVVLNYK